MAESIIHQLAGVHLSLRQRLLIYVPVITIAVLAIMVAVLRPYTQGSDFGYYLGLAGGLMMLSLFLYPIRKYWTKLDRVGSLRAWFTGHIVMGIGGPLLILFHSTFQTKSINGGVAFWSMIVVVISGLVGRYIYVLVYEHLDHGNAALSSLDAYLQTRADAPAKAAGFSPAAFALMDQYRQFVATSLMSTGGRIWSFVTMAHREQRIIKQCKTEIVRAVKAEAMQNQWANGRLRSEVKAEFEIVDDYIRAANATVRYAYWERKLAKWNLVHIPLVYILLVSGVYHVVAVHMY
jgi:uncharacterized protein (UPF0333 family)